MPPSGGGRPHGPGESDPRAPSFVDAVLAAPAGVALLAQLDERAAQLVNGMSFGQLMAVHLSWAGFLTTEGYVCDLEAGAVTMLRYWGSERTLWLADVFGDPAPLGAPVLSGRVNGDLGVDIRADQARQQRDLDVSMALLGR